MKIPVILFLIALTIRLAAIQFWQFDGLYGQDAYAYFNQAVAIGENLPRGEPPPTDFFWPNGYPLLIAFLMLLAGPTAWAGQLAALLCGSALAPLTYLLSRDLWLERPATGDQQLRDRPHATGHTLHRLNSATGHRAGLLAGLIIAVAGQPILSSIVIMSDMPALFWVTLSIWLVVRAVNFEQEGNYSSTPLLLCPPALLYFAAGAALAVAIITRWLYGLVIPALGFYSLAGLRRRRIPWWTPLAAILTGLIILAPQLWLSAHKPEGLAHSFLWGWSPAHFWQRQFETGEGRFSYLLPMALFYAQPAGHPAYIFPWLGLAALWAIWRLWQRKGWTALILLLGWAGPVYIFLAGIPFQNFRFGLALYPPLVILTGFGLSDLLSRGAENRQRRNFSLVPLPPGPPAVLWGVIALSLAGMLAWAYPMLDDFLTVHNRSKLIARQVEQTLPSEATLLTFGLTLTLQHYTRLHTLELFYLDEAGLKSLTRSSAPLYLLLDVDNVETQWQGKAPQLNYHWLKKNTTLSETATFPPFVLFEVSVTKP